MYYVNILKNDLLAMTNLNLDMFVLDAKYVQDIYNPHLCLIIRVSGLDTNYYLSDKKNLQRLSSYERIPANKTTMNLRFNSLIRVKIYTG